MMHRRLLLSVMVLAVAAAGPAFAKQGGGLAKGKGAFSTFGNAALVKAGSKPAKWAIELTSYDYREVEDFYAGISYEPAEGLLVSDLENLSAKYEVTEGTFGGGSPRFSIGVDTDGDGDANGYLFVYLGTPPDYTDGPSGVVDSGNLLEGFVDSSQLGGEFYGTWEEALELVGDDEVVSIDLVADGGWATEGGTQAVAIYEVQVNNDTFRPNGSDKKSK